MVIQTPPEQILSLLADISTPTWENLIPWLIGVLVTAILGGFAAMGLWIRSVLTKMLSDILDEVRLFRNVNEKLAKSTYLLTFKITNPEADVKEAANEGLRELEK